MYPLLSLSLDRSYAGTVYDIARKRENDGEAGVLLQAEPTRGQSYLVFEIVVHNELLASISTEMCGRMPS